MDEKTILIGVLTKTLNRSEQEVAELLYQEDGEELKLKDDVIDDILSLDSARVENIKKNAPVPQDRLENEYKRGQKEALTKLEKSLKDKYSIESDKEGVELVDSILSAKTKPTKLTDDEVKKHPLYLDLEKKRVAREEYDALKDEYSEFKNRIEKDKKFDKVKDMARLRLKEMKPIVSDNPTVAKTREDDFLTKFESHDYQFDDDNIIVLKKDGTRMEDGHGNPLPFNDFVRMIAEMNYDFAKQDSKGNSGQSDDKDKRPNITVPKNDEEYVQAMNNAATFEEKKAIYEAYNVKK